MKIKLKTLDDANKLAAICGTFEEDIDIVVGRYIIDAKSYLGILSIGFSNEMNVIFHSSNIKLKQYFYKMIERWKVEE